MTNLQVVKPDKEHAAGDK
ncbi:hypothetical protein NPIL_297501, partial [Nephila pilipes]